MNQNNDVVVDIKPKKPEALSMSRLLVPLTSM